MTKLGALIHATKALWKDRVASSKVFETTLKRVKDAELDTHRAIALFSLLDADVNNWFLLVEPKEDTMEHSHINVHALVFALVHDASDELVDYILSKLDLSALEERVTNEKKVMVGLAQLIITGRLEAFVHFQQRFPDVFYWSDTCEAFPLVTLLHAWSELMLAGKPRQSVCDLYTWGENDGISLGHTGGTLPKWPLKLTSPKGKRNVHSVDKVELGLSTTVFVTSNRPFVHISGKLGAKHYLEPEAFEFKEPIVCAAVGSSHLLLCTKRGYYAIGDNGGNRMGCGAENPTIKSFRFFEIERHLFEEDDHIVDCVTSSNHSVISTNNGFLVAGTSFGQMGAYAQRVYSRRDGKPNSFTRLNAPDDTFSRPHRGFLGASVLDRTTVLSSGSRVKVFVDYEEREFTVTKTAAGAYIVSANACKPQFNQSKVTVALFMSTCELWLWDKTAGLSLVWRLGKYPASMPMGQHSFAFGANGNFMFVHDVSPVFTEQHYGCQTRKSFTAPTFLFTFRGAGNVLRKAAASDNTIQLKKVPDETVEAFVDFIFTGTCELFNTLLGGATDRRCATELEEDEEDVLASKLRRLRTLAADLEYDALHTAADKFLQQLYDADNSDAALVDWSDENLFANFSVDVTNLFPDGNVLIVCSDRRFKFSGEILKLKSAYFETLFRWNEEEQTEVISFEEFPFRLVKLALFFFLTEDLREANLSFEELVEVFFFADRYGLTDLIAQVVDLLEEELVIGRLDDFFDLLQNFYAPDLEAVVSEFVYANLVSVLESKCVGHIPQNILDNVNDKIRSYYSSQTDLLNVLPSYKTVDTDSPVVQQFADAAEEVFDEVLPALSDAEFTKFCDSPISFLKLRLRGEAADRRERKSTCRSSTEKETTADSGILSCAADTVNDSVNMDETAESHEADEQDDEVPAPSEHPSKKGRRKIRYRLFSSDDQAGVNDAPDVARKISESSNASESSFSLSNRSSNAAWVSSPSTPHSLTKSLREIQLEEEQAMTASASRRSQETRISAPQAQSTPLKAERKRFVSSTSVENGPVLSLREIQEQELAAVAQAKAAEQQFRTAHQASAQREQSRRVSTPFANEPARNGHVSSPQPMSLREIQAQEQASLDAAAAARVKPLWALQKEEQAMAELYNYYGQLFTDGTLVTIRRIPPRTT